MQGVLISTLDLSFRPVSFFAIVITGRPPQSYFLVEFLLLLVNDDAVFAAGVAVTDSISEIRSE